MAQVTDPTEKLYVTNHDETPRLAVPAAAAPASDVGQRLQVRICYRLIGEHSVLARPNERLDSLVALVHGRRLTASWRIV